MACCFSELIFTVPKGREELSVPASLLNVLPASTAADPTTGGFTPASLWRLCQEPAKKPPPRSTRNTKAYKIFFIGSFHKGD
jgi:hypothetical protein